jgi:hypothetical protein
MPPTPSPARFPTTDVVERLLGVVRDMTPTVGIP